MATKKLNVNVPAGFHEIDNGMLGFWKPEVPGQSLQGVVASVVITKGAEGKDNKFYTVRITNPEKTAPIMGADDKEITPEAGDLVGVGGAMLVSFMSGREGQEVFLVYKGLGAKKKGKNPAKLFGTYVRETSDGEIPV